MKRLAWMIVAVAAVLYAGRRRRRNEVMEMLRHGTPSGARRP